MGDYGTISAIIGTAGGGFRLSLILNAVGSEVASSGVEIQPISKGVTLFAQVLKQVGQHLQGADSLHRSEALETARRITDEGQVVYDEISDMLDKVQHIDGTDPTFSNIQHRFKTCFKKHRVLYLLAQLESLKITLLLLLQVLQLGKLMAVPARSTSKEEIAMKQDIISQERAEIQNLVIVRYWALSRLDRLYAAAEEEERQDRRAEDERRNQDLTAHGQPQLAIEGPADEAMAATVVKLQVVSLGELDQTLNRIRDSPRDMIRVSDSVIDPLLERWTRWREVRDVLEHRPGSAGRYAPSVEDLYESDGERHQSASRTPFHYDTSHPENTEVYGYYLEGRTTDWRHPHSLEAKREAARLRQRYSSFQPSVDSEDEERREKRGFKAKAPSRHVINSSSSSSSSSDSEAQHQRAHVRRRKSGASRSGASTPDKKRDGDRNGHHRHAYKDGSNLAKFATSPSAVGSTPRSSMSSQPSPNTRRPPAVHATTAPLPPLHTGNVPNPYQGIFPPVQSPTALPGPYIPSPSAQRYMPPQPLQPLQPFQPPQAQRISPLRPSSSEGKQRSPNRSSSSHPAMDEEEKRQQRLRHQKNIRRGATRGLLGVGAVAGFLEALEGLTL